MIIRNHQNIDQVDLSLDLFQAIHILNHLLQILLNLYYRLLVKAVIQ